MEGELLESQPAPALAAQREGTSAAATLKTLPGGLEGWNFVADDEDCWKAAGRQGHGIL